MKKNKIFFLIIIIFIFYNNSFASKTSTQIDSSFYYIISEINIFGNKKTKPKVILREITYEQGDSICLQNINSLHEQSKQNLLKTQLFNFVTITHQVIDSLTIVININVEERWYLWPQVYVAYADRNFSAWLQHKDFRRIKYSIALEKYNFRELQQKLRFQVVFGYETEFRLFYNNIYLDKKRRHSLDFDFIYAKNKNIAYNTFQNKLQFYKSENGFMKKKIAGTIVYRYRPTFNIKHELILKRHYFKVNDSLLLLNSNYFTNNSLTAEFFDLEYIYTINKTDANNYPLKGYYFRFSLHKQGFFKKIDNVDLFSIKIKLKKYFQFSDRIYYGTGVYIYKSLNSKKPYYFSQALGYSDYIRGYEYYVIDGYDYFLNKNALKYQILKNFIIKMNFIPFSQFNKTYLSIYINLNFDFGYANNPYTSAINENNLQNKLLYGYGLGVDFETYYDYVFRIEYTINKQLEHGFYFQVGAPI